MITGRLAGPRTRHVRPVPHGDLVATVPWPEDPLAVRVSGEPPTDEGNRWHLLIRSSCSTAPYWAVPQRELDDGLRETRREQFLRPLGARPRRGGQTDERRRLLIGQGSDQQLIGRRRGVVRLVDDDDRGAPK